MKFLKLGIWILISVGLLSGCASFPRATVDSMSALGKDETLVVGRVEIVPALLDSEQAIRLAGGKSFYEKTLFVLTSDENREIRGKLKSGDLNGQIRAELNKDFYVSNGNKPFFITGGLLYLEVTHNYENRLIFPGGYEIPIQSGDKAVYIGTLQYHRNEYFDITKITIVDDYERANAEFKKKYGAKYSLRKALLKEAN